MLSYFFFLEAVGNAFRFIAWNLESVRFRVFEPGSSFETFLSDRSLAQVAEAAPGGLGLKSTGENVKNLSN